MSDIGESIPATLQAFLTDYPDVAPAEVSFTVTLIDPCLTTSLEATTVSDFSFVAYSENPVSVNFNPFTDTAAVGAKSGTGVPSLCGPRNYEIVETTPKTFLTITPPVDEKIFESPWNVTGQTNVLDNVQVWNVTLRATLANYSGI